MAKQVTVKIDSAGLHELLKSPEVAAICESVATDVMARLPDTDGYEMNTYSGKTRVNVSIGTATPKAWRDNLENNTLLKALERK